MASGSDDGFCWVEASHSWGFATGEIVAPAPLAFFFSSLEPASACAGTGGRNLFALRVQRPSGTPKDL